MSFRRRPASAAAAAIAVAASSRIVPIGWRVLSNFVLYELRRSSTGKIEVWPGRVEHHLRRKPDGSLVMFFKKVMLIHGDEAVPSLAFII